MNHQPRCELADFDPYAHYLAYKYPAYNSGADSQDVFQEAMIGAWRALGKWDGRGDQMAYVKLQMKLRVIDYVRSRWRVYSNPNRDTLPLDPDSAGPDATFQAVLEREELRAVVEAVKALPRCQRERITDRLEGRTNIEIAAAAGCTVTAIDMTFWRSKKTIKLALAA